MDKLQYESIYGYCRVSSDEQAKHGTSLAEQKKTITKMSMYLFEKRTFSPSGLTLGFDMFCMSQ